MTLFEWIVVVLLVVMSAPVWGVALLVGVASLCVAAETLLEKLPRWRR